MSKVSEICYTETDTIRVPDVRYFLARIPNGWTTVALRGYKYVKAVIDVDGVCQGWGEVPHSDDSRPTPTRGLTTPVTLCVAHTK